MLFATCLTTWIRRSFRSLAEIVRDEFYNFDMNRLTEKPDEVIELLRSELPTLTEYMVAVCEFQRLRNVDPPQLSTQDFCRYFHITPTELFQLEGNDIHNVAQYGFKMSVKPYVLLCKWWNRARQQATTPRMVAQATHPGAGTHSHANHRQEGHRGAPSPVQSTTTERQESAQATDQSNHATVVAGPDPTLAESPWRAKSAGRPSTVTPTHVLMSNYHTPQASSSENPETTKKVKQEEARGAPSPIQSSSLTASSGQQGTSSVNPRTIKANAMRTSSHSSETSSAGSGGAVTPAGSVNLLAGSHMGGVLSNVQRAQGKRPFKPRSRFDQTEGAGRAWKDHNKTEHTAPPVQKKRRIKQELPLSEKYANRGTQLGVFPKKSLWKYVMRGAIYVVEVVTGNVSPAGKIEVVWRGYGRRQVNPRVSIFDLRVLTDEDIEIFDRNIQEMRGKRKAG